MIHKLLAGKGRMKKGLSILLCLALLGSSVISANVTAEAESEVTVEAVDLSETDEVEAAEVSDEVETAETTDDEADATEAAEETETAETAETETTADETAEEAMEAETMEESGTAEITDETAEAENVEEPESINEEYILTEEETTASSETEETVSASEEVDTETIEEETNQEEAETTTETEIEEIVTETEETSAVTVTSVSSSATVSATATTANDSADSSDEENTSKMPAVTLVDSTDDVDVSVNAPEGAFTEGVSMVVSKVDVDDFEAAVLADCEALGDSYTVYDAAAVDISFYDADGNEVQPATEVEVTLSGLDLAVSDENGNTAEYALIYHMDNDGNAECVEDQDPGQESYTFMASSFSTYGVVNISVEYGISTEASYSESYTVAVGYSQTISANSSGQGGQGGQGQNTSISSYTVTATTGTTEGVTVTENYGGGGPNQNQSIQSLTVTGVTVGTVVEITVTYSNGDTGTYTVTIIDPADLTVDHIDIDISTTAVLYINGEKYEVDVTLTEDDYTSDNVTLTAAYKDGTSVTYDWDLDNIDTSSGSGGESQLRVSGTFPIGTEENPVYYTFTLTKDVTFTVNGVEYTVTVTFTSTFSFWDDDNACPGLGNGWASDKKWSSSAGMDFALGSGSSTRSVLTIYKYVYDSSGNLLTEADGCSYTFEIYDSTDTTEASKTVTLTVHDGIGMYTTDVDPGNYYVTETDYESAIGSYTYNKTDTSSSYIKEDDEGNEQTATETTNTVTTATMTVSADGTTIYTINNYYEPVTITIKKEVTGNMGDTEKEFTFTLTDENGDSVGTDSDGNVLNSFQLSDGEEQTIYGLTVGDTVYLIESNNSGYTVTVKDADGNTIEAENGKYAITVGSGVVITVTNNYDIDPDTGFSLDSLPYLLMLAGVALLGGVVLFGRRRRLL